MRYTDGNPWTQRDPAPMREHIRPDQATVRRSAYDAAMWRWVALKLAGEWMVR